MFCSKCGAPNEEGTLFCGNCGAAMEAGDQPEAEPVVAAVDAAVEDSEPECGTAAPVETPAEEATPAGFSSHEAARASAPGLGSLPAAAGPAPVASSRKLSPDSAFLVEFLAGIFGLLGAGYLAAGKTNEGIVRLVVWLVYTVLAWVVISALSAILVGLLCIPFQLVLQIGVPLWSANKLKKQLLAEG